MELGIKALPQLCESRRTPSYFCRFDGSSRLRIRHDRQQHRQGAPSRTGRKRVNPSEAIDRSRGCVKTKIMSVAGALASLADFRGRPEQAHNPRGTAALVDGLICGQVLAERACDAILLSEVLARAKTRAVIPPKPNRRVPAEFDSETYKWQYVIENLFGKRKDFRASAMRCFKTDKSKRAFIAIAGAIIRLQ